MYRTYRKSFDVIGFSYDADTYCIACTQKRFAHLTDDVLTCDTVLEDSEGNPIQVMFLGDSDGSECCGSCRENLSESSMWYINE